MTDAISASCLVKTFGRTPDSTSAQIQARRKTGCTTTRSLAYPVQKLLLRNIKIVGFGSVAIPLPKRRNSGK
jgi:hypothetical protein